MNRKGEIFNLENFIELNMRVLCFERINGNHLVCIKEGKYSLLIN